MVGNPMMVVTRSRNGEHELTPAIASYRHASGNVFLVHRSVDDASKFCTTYAPVGMHAGLYDTIDAAIDKLESQPVDRVTQIIASAQCSLQTDYTPALSSEFGIPGTWRNREQWRFDLGEYRALPAIGLLKDNPLPVEHYAHVSTESEDMIAYTPNDDYGTRDRQVRLKFGKYLKKTFPSMADSLIQSAVVEYRARMAQAPLGDKLEFTTERTMINEIFETEMCACNSGQVSCMHGKFDDWKHRPYHVYADSPDVAVAYMTVDGRIVARSVVSTKDKVYVRLYSRSGCETLCAQLKEALKEAGYRHGELEGNRLSKLPMRNGIHVLPYIDNGGCKVSDGGEWWMVDSDGGYECCNTNGTADGAEPMCERCDRELDDCRCTYCDCCEESFYHGCDEFSMCEHCELCRTHDRCECNICSECDALIDSGPMSYRCSCNRCEHCEELTRNCECVFCSDCDELEENCTCENEAEAEAEADTEQEIEAEETETEPAPVAVTDTREEWVVVGSYTAPLVAE